MISPTAALHAMEMGISAVTGNPRIEEASPPIQHTVSYWDDLDSKVITIYQIFCTVIAIGAVALIFEGSVLKDPYILTASITALGLSTGGFMFAGRVRNLKVVADLGRRVEELEDQITQLDRIKNEQESNFRSQITEVKQHSDKISKIGRKLAIHVTVLKNLNKRLENNLKTFNNENDELKISNDELQQSLVILNESIAKLSGIGTQHLKRQATLLEREEDATEHLEQAEQEMEKLLNLTKLVKIIKELNPAIIAQAEQKLGFEVIV